VRALAKIVILCDQRVVFFSDDTEKRATMSTRKGGGSEFRII